MPERENSQSITWKNRFEVKGADVSISHGKRKRPPRHRQGQKFLKGPIPLAWLQEAAKQKGKALHIAIVLWHIVGIRNRNEVQVNLSRLLDFGISRLSAYRGLSALEKAGLILVTRHLGRKSTVQLLNYERVTQ